MKRILLTGISGTGKSTVIEELASRGYPSVDLDSPAYSEWAPVSDDSAAPGTPVEPDRDWVWREDRVQELLSSEGGEVLFVSGSAANMGRFLPRFDLVILLSAPPGVVARRLANRTNNPYGSRPEEVRRVLDLMKSVEPLLRRVADHEIDTSASLAAVVASVLRLADIEN